MTVIILCVFAFLAGFVDSVVGGGGLIQLPILMIMFPTTSFGTLAGTNKISSICGTFTAVLRYKSKISFDKHVLIYAVPFALIFSFVGARTVSLIDSNIIKPIIIATLILVGIYTFFKPNLGSNIKSKTNLSKLRLIFLSSLIGMTLGFYDGLIGPGTGSFLIFAFIMLLGMDFFNASANAKIVNLATNLAATIFFIYTNQVMWQAAVAMAAANIAGSTVGTSMAIKNGNAWIRKMFLVVVVLILAKLVYDTFV